MLALWGFQDLEAKQQALALKLRRAAAPRAHGAPQAALDFSAKDLEIRRTAEAAEAGADSSRGALPPERPDFPRTGPAGCSASSSSGVSLLSESAEEATDTARRPSTALSGGAIAEGGSLGDGGEEAFLWLSRLQQCVDAGEFPGQHLLGRAVEQQQQVLRLVQGLQRERDDYVEAVASLHSQ